MIGRNPGDRVEGRVIVAIYRKRGKEFLVPLIKTHRGKMCKLYDCTCVVEVPFRLKET